MNPIPEHARPADPRWAVEFQALARGLVIAGAKGKIIERFTDLPHRKVSELYKALRGFTPPTGPVTQGSVRQFAVPSNHISPEWIIQCAIFMACYERMGKFTAERLHRGWQLLTTFNGYLSLTDKLSQTTSVKQLDINQAYALMSFCGFMTSSAGVELQRTVCPVCSIKYPVVAGEELARQHCPVCTVSATGPSLSRTDCASDSEDTPLKPA